MVAIVTGAASGIGLAVARKLLDKGVCVVGMSRRESMENLGEGFSYVSGDSTYAFTMPDKNVTVAVAFENSNYNLHILPP